MISSRRIVFSPRAYQSLLQQLIDNGEPVAPRGVETREMLNTTLVLRNPIDRVIPDRGRKMNIAFAIAEWHAIMFGVDNIAWYQRFIRDYDKYSSDGKHLDGAYATRIQRYGGDDSLPYDQIEAVIGMLKEDPLTRRAVISIYGWNDLFGAGGVNTPCTLTLQFLNRGGRLHMIVNMRSSDVVKGLTYDCFLFTLIQEHVARQTGLPLGSYIHNAASFHIYETDVGLLEKLHIKRWPYLMPEMPTLTLSALAEYGDVVDLLDEKPFFEKVTQLMATPAGLYLADFALVMKAFVERNREQDLSDTAYSMVENPTLKYVLRPWLVSAGVLKDRAL